MNTVALRKAIKAIDQTARVVKFSDGRFSIRTDEITKVLAALPGLGLIKEHSECEGSRYSWTYLLIVAPKETP